jgi:hypothetical protein
MNTLDIINKTREYLDYVEEHYANIQKAWAELQGVCKDMHFVYDDFVFHTISGEVENHDLSKLSKEEFVQYRENFFLCDGEPSHSPTDFMLAWEHHKTHNPHHYETWTTMAETYPNELTVHCVHMVLDWMAMGYKFNDTAEEFYAKNRERMALPEWADNLLGEIFEKLYHT